MTLREVATISGKSGLFKVIKPTWNGVVVEPINEKPVRTVVPSSSRISILGEITLYTTSVEETFRLDELLYKIYAEEGENITVDPNSEGSLLHEFLGKHLPEYDRDRVYTSDIKKIVTWYHTLCKLAPQALTKPEPETKSEEISSSEEAAK